MAKKNKKQNLLNIITGIVGLTIWIILLILAIMVNVRLGEEDYSVGYHFGLNWAQTPIESFDIENQNTCSIGSSYGLIQTYFPGFKVGCYCKPSNYYPGYCNSFQLKQGCTQFPETSPKLLVSWGGTLCTKRQSNNTFFNLEITAPEINNGTCGNNTRSCGLATTLGGNLCVDVNSDCPINYIQVVNETNDSNSFHAIQQRGFNVTEVPFINSTKKFIYSNQNEANGQIVNTFIITDHTPCADSTENKIELISEEGNYQCKRKINGYTNDNSYILLDTMTIGELLNDNGLLSQIQQYPFYDSIQNRTVSLYYRSYIGLNQTCLDDANTYLFPKNITSIPSIFLNMKKTITNSYIDFISVPGITLYVIIFIGLMMKITVSCNESSRQSYRLYISVALGFLLILLLIIGIVSSINISDARNLYVWFYNTPSCSDPIDQGLINIFDSKIKEAYIIAVIFTVLTLVLFFDVILEYLVFHSYDDEEQEEKQENENRKFSEESSKLLEKENENQNVEMKNK